MFELLSHTLYKNNKRQLSSIMCQAISCIKHNRFSIIRKSSIDTFHPFVKFSMPHKDLPSPPSESARATGLPSLPRTVAAPLHMTHAIIIIYHFAFFPPTRSSTHQIALFFLQLFPGFSNIVTTSLNKWADCTDY